MVGAPWQAQGLCDDEAVLVKAGDAGGGMLFFQVLSVATEKPKVVRTFRGIRRRRFHYTLQMFEAWGAGPAGAERITAFASGDAIRMDARSLSSWGSLRHSLQRWESVVSDVCGCVDLVNPVPAVPDAPLDNPSCPTIMVFEALAQQGWATSTQHCSHTRDSEKRLSIKEGGDKKLYFQCLLRLSEIFDLGVQRLPSNQPQSFYKALLSGRCVAPDKGRKYYDNMLKDARVVIADASEQLSVEQPEAILDMVEPVVEATDYTHDLFQPVEAVATAPAPEDALPLEDLVSPPMVDIVDNIPPLCGAADGGGAPAGAMSDDWDGWPRLVDGARVRRSSWDEPGKSYVRFSLVCTYHSRCEKYRNAGESQTRRHGRMEPFAYLAAWHKLGAACPARAHIRQKPTMAQQEAWLREQGLI